jgi:hypothetical protein
MESPLILVYRPTLVMTKYDNHNDAENYYKATPLICRDRRLGNSLTQLNATTESIFNPITW